MGDRQVGTRSSISSFWKITVSHFILFVCTFLASWKLTKFYLGYFTVILRELFFFLIIVSLRSCFSWLHALESAEYQSVFERKFISHIVSHRMVAFWCSGSVVCRIHEAVLRRTRLMLGLVTILDGQSTSVIKQPPGQLILASLLGR